MNQDRLKELQKQLRPVTAPLTIEEHARGFSQASLDKYLRERFADDPHAYVKDVYARHVHQVKLADQAIEKFWRDRGLTVAQAKAEPTPLWPETKAAIGKLEKAATAARALLADAAHNLGISEEVLAIQSRMAAIEKAKAVDAGLRAKAEREAAMTVALAEMPEL
jgi:hypothetical protein